MPGEGERSARRGPRPRGTVRSALVDAGLELARSGGPDAVVLREVTRMVGVVPNAAYRHFSNRDALLAAVRDEAVKELAARMGASISQVRAGPHTPTGARLRLRAVGEAYLEFARTQARLFDTAFATPDRPCSPRRSRPPPVRPVRRPRSRHRWAICRRPSTTSSAPDSSPRTVARTSSTRSGRASTGSRSCCADRCNRYPNARRPDSKPKRSRSSGRPSAEAHTASRPAAAFATFSARGASIDGGPDRGRAIGAKIAAGAGAAPQPDRLRVAEPF